MEEWKPIESWEGRYEVSNQGRVRSLTDGKNPRLTPLIRICSPNRSGHLMVSLGNVRGRKLHTSVHRLVALAFVHRPEGCDVVNHLDGEKLNNRFDNLEWTTVSGNNAHARRMGLILPGKGGPIMRGADNPASVAIKQFDLQNRLIAEHASMTDAAKAIGVSRALIGHCIYGRSKTARGFIFKASGS